MKRLALVFSVTLLNSLPALAATHNATSAQIVVVKEAFADRLKAPYSTRFKNVQIATDGTLCGQVNAKNSCDAYFGYTAFNGLYFDKDKNGNPVAVILAIDDEDSPIAQVMCAKKGL